jgi:hypothetical protein
MDIVNLTGALAWFRSKSWLQDQVNDLFIPIEDAVTSDEPPRPEEMKRHIAATRQIRHLVKSKRGYGLNRATAEFDDTLRELKSKLDAGQPDDIESAHQHARSAAKKLRRAIDRLEP